jgi:hypothetical protein
VNRAWRMDFDKITSESISNSDAELFVQDFLKNDTFVASITPQINDLLHDFAKVQKTTIEDESEPAVDIEKEPKA